MNEVKFVCLNCNKEIGRGDKKSVMPQKCKFCGGGRITTQELIIDDRKSFDYEVIILNKLTGKRIASGFTIGPKEYVGATSEQLKVIFATRLSEALGKSLTTKTTYELVSDVIGGI